MAAKKPVPGAENGLLFASLAEQVKMPFIQIAHAAELLRLHPDKASLDQLFNTITLTSEAALKLIDAYLLNVQLQQISTLPLEPVSLSSILFDTASELNSYAEAHDCEIELLIKGKHGPVMGRHDVLKTALTSLGYAFIEAISQQDSKTKLSLVARKTSHGLSAGMFSGVESLSAQLFKQAKILKGIARQPLSDFSAGSGAGVFVADALLSRLDSPMKVARYDSKNGLVTTLQPSMQLTLV